jgi:DNA-binding MarR family transcriptional regulator
LGNRARPPPSGGILPKKKLKHEDYKRLLEFRTGLRTFLSWSKQQAAAAGLAPTQHQMLLAVRGHDDERGPTIGDIAGYLLVKPHTAAELVDRAQAAGLVTKSVDLKDGRVVRVRLTKLADTKLESITAATLEELERLGPRLKGIWEGL